jgi:hypothetical protein
MKVEKILERMDLHIELLTDSVNRMSSYQKDEVKEMYGTIKTYNECLNLETGALNTMISFRQWIVNNKDK